MASAQANKGTNVRIYKNPVPPVVRAGMALAAGVSPELAARVAERLFTTPRRHRRPRGEVELLRGARRFLIPDGATRLAAWSWGEGPTVLLVHGWEGRGAQLGSFVAPLVASGRRVVTYDAPAHGESVGERATLADFARVVAAAAKAVGPLDGVVAHSLGAAATTIALSRGVEARRVVYLAPAVEVGAAVRRFAEFLGLSEAAAAGLRRRIEERTGVSVSAIEGRHLAPALTAPLLLVHDRKDREVPVDDALGLASSWRGARLRLTTGLGHRRLLRADEVVAEAVGFVTGVRPTLSPRPSPQALLDRELYHREERWPGAYSPVIP